MKLTLDTFRVPAAALLAVVIIAVAEHYLFANRNAAPAAEVPPVTITKKIETAADPMVRFGFIRAVEKRNGMYSVVFDEAQFFGNTPSTSTALESADLAAIEDGVCTKEDALASKGACAPNNFYLRNNSASTTIFQLTSKTRIQVLAQPRSEKEAVHLTPISLANFTKAFAEPNSNSGTYYSLKEGPYILKLNKQGQIVSLEGQYLP